MKVAIIGAGTMGRDIALNLAAYDIHCVLMDCSELVLEGVRDDMKKRLRFYKMSIPKFRDVTKEQINQRITLATNFDDMADIDWVIENVPEDWDIKSKVYLALDKVIPPTTPIAVNTSCISISRVAALVGHPERVIGMHFMNPVPMKPAVEGIRGFHTSEETITKAKALLKSIDKKIILVNDSPGFVANRLSHLFMNEAAFLVQENVADAQSIDAIFKEGYGHAMGPLETADLIGLDTVLNSLKVLYDSYQDSKFRCCPLLQKMVDAGLLGRKSGRGFYTY